MGYPGDMIWREILSIFLLVLLNSLFALTEMAVVTSRKARVQHKASLGQASYRHLLQVMEEPSNFLSTIQVAISLIGIFAGALGGATLGDEAANLFAGLGLDRELAGTLGMVLVVLGTTYVSVVVGELVPKRLALNNPEPIAVVMQYPVRLISLLFFPLVKLLSLSSGLILWLLGIRKASETSVSQEELRILVAEGAESGVLEHLEHHLLDEVLLLGERKVTAFMRPRMSVPCVDEAATDQELLDFVRAHVGEDALPVIKGTIDHLVAMVDIRLALASLATNGRVVRKDCFRLPVVIPGSYDGLRTLELLAERSTQDTAVVLDEFGGVEGIVCLQDILEALVSSSPDQEGGAGTGGGSGPDQGKPGEVYVLPVDLDGSTPVSELARRTDLPAALLAGDFETLAGLYLLQAGQIPAAGDWIECAGWRLTVLAMDHNRIARIRLDRSDGPEAEDGGLPVDGTPPGDGQVPLAGEAAENGQAPGDAGPES